MTGTISTVGRLSGVVSSGQALSGVLSLSVYSPPLYEGEYEFTPTDEEQVIEIKDKYANANIIVNPIPNNYGLVTWDGSTITVS